MSTEKSEQEESLAEQLLKKRIILIDKDTSSENCSEWIGRILLLDLIKPKKPIIILVNCYGGDIYPAFGLVSIIEKTVSPVITVCIGVAQSMGSVILASGHKRYSVKNAEILIHQHWHDFEETVNHDELINQAERSKLIIKDLTDFYLSKTKMTKLQIEKLLKKDSFITPDEALKYGIIDGIEWSIQDWIK